MSWIEYLKQAEILIGVILTVISVLTAAAAWFWKRVANKAANKADLAVSPLRIGQEDIVRRLGQVEVDLSSAKEDIERVDKHVQAMEAKLSSLASRKDLVEVQVSLAKVQATGEASENMIRTLYSAVLRAGGTGE